MDQLSERRDRLVGALLGEVGPDVSATSLARAASVVLHADNATISILDPERGPSVVASHGPLAGDLELLQLGTGDGPTLAALADDRTVVSREPESWIIRWPAFGPEATARGVTALFSRPLRPRRSPAGALSLYATDPVFLDEGRIGDVLLLADMVAEALADPGLRGLDGRLRQVGEEASGVHHATGVLVARQGLSPAQALSTLRGQAVETRSPLASVAAQLMQGGTVGPPG